MNVLIKPQADQTSGILRTVAITPQIAGWQYVSFAVYHLTRGQAFRGAADGRETVLVVLYGTGRARATWPTRLPRRYGERDTG